MAKNSSKKYVRKDGFRTESFFGGLIKFSTTATRKDVLKRAREKQQLKNSIKRKKK